MSGTFINRVSTLKTRRFTSSSNGYCSQIITWFYIDITKSESMTERVLYFKDRPEGRADQGKVR